MEPVGAAPYWRAVIHTREKRFFSPTKKDLEPVSPYIFIYIYIWQHAPVPSSVNLDRRRRTRASEICSRWKNQFVDRAASFWFPLQEYRYHYSWLAFFLYDLEEIWYRCPRFLFPRSFFSLYVYCIEEVLIPFGLELPTQKIWESRCSTPLCASMGRRFKLGGEHWRYLIFFAALRKGS